MCTRNSLPRHAPAVTTQVNSACTIKVTWVGTQRVVQLIKLLPGGGGGGGHSLSAHLTVEANFSFPGSTADGT